MCSTFYLEFNSRSGFRVSDMILEVSGVFDIELYICTAIFFMREGFNTIMYFNNT